MSSLRERIEARRREAENNSNFINNQNIRNTNVPDDPIIDIFSYDESDNAASPEAKRRKIFNSKNNKGNPTGNGQYISKQATKLPSGNPIQTSTSASSSSTSFPREQNSYKNENGNGISNYNLYNTGSFPSNLNKPQYQMPLEAVKFRGMVNSALRRTYYGNANLLNAKKQNKNEDKERENSEKNKNSGNQNQASAPKSSHLNPEQLQAALSDPERPLLVKAGAGTGKTTLVMRRLQYFIQEKNINPKQILALSYTNTACNEMRDRLKKQIPEAAGKLFVSTIHRVANLIVRCFWDRLERGKLYPWQNRSSRDSTLKSNSENDVPVKKKSQFAKKKKSQEGNSQVENGKNITHGANSSTKNNLFIPKFSKMPNILTSNDMRETIVQQGLQEFRVEVARKELSKYLFKYEASKEKYKSWVELIDEFQKKHFEKYITATGLATADEIF